jgi:hypothetical protein
MSSDIKDFNYFIMVNVTQMTQYHAWRITIKNKKTIDFKSGVSFSEHNMYVTV